MRLFFVGFFLTGLLLIGYSVHERRHVVTGGGAVAPMITNEDGTGFPNPYPTPKPKK
jgi:hypothetical protein